MLICVPWPMAASLSVFVVMEEMENKRMSTVMELEELWTFLFSLESC